MRSMCLVALLMAACGGADDEVIVDARGDAPIDGVVEDAPDGPVPDAPVPDGAGPDGPPLMNPGFRTPTAVTKANTFSNGQWTEVGDADWSCLNTPSTDQPSSGSIMLAGTVRDFQTDNGVGGAQIFAWSTGPAVTVGMGTSSDAAATRGQYAMTLGMLPSGTTRYGFTLTAPSYLTTHVVGVYHPPGVDASDDLPVMSESTATALPAFIGVTRDVTKGMVIGRMRDCQGRAVSNAAVGLSSQPGTYVDASGSTFYFSASATSLPVRGNVAPVMNRDGMYMVINANPANVLVQVWGFRSNAELNSGSMTLLAEALAPVDASTTAFADLEPRRN